MCRTSSAAGCSLWVPGRRELPIVAQQMARSGQYQVLITLGAVTLGGHAPFRCGGVEPGVAKVRRASTSVPVIFGVLTTDTMQQALERAGIKSNLGWSYGRSPGMPDARLAVGLMLQAAN